MHRGSLLAVVLSLACLAVSSESLSAAGATQASGGGSSDSLASLPVVPMDADLSLTIWGNVSVAEPGDPVLLFVRTENSGNRTATNLTLEVPLDPNSTYGASFPNATYDPVNRTLRWTVASLSPGAQTDVWWTIRITVGTPDNTTIWNRFRVTYHNETGMPLPPEEITLPVRVQAPVFAPQLRPLPTGAGRGEIVVAKLYVNNTGSATAVRAWSNWTLGGHFRFLFLDEPLSVTNVTDGFDVTLSNLAPGAHTLTAHLEVLRSLDDGLAMGIQTQWTATDGNGNVLAPITRSNSVSLFAPRFTLDLSAASRVNTSSRFVLTATLRNTGREAGTGWLNLTLPGAVSFIADNGSFPRTNQGKRYSWTIPSLSPGSSLVLGITFESGPDADSASFVFALTFTDGQGSPPASAPAPRIDIEFVTSTADSPDPAEVFPWWAALVAAAGLAAVAFWWRRRRASEVQIEDVFVADMGGHLLAHRSSGLVAYEDEDILIGMFKVIQDFVRDSFAKGTNDQMKSMEFGERRIIIERGQYHFISVVYRGVDHGRLAERVRKISRVMDLRFGKALENWSGDLDELRGLASLLPLIWKHRPRSKASARPGPAARPGIRGPSGTGRAKSKPGPLAESSGPSLTAEPPK